jgi:hypothetical protein
MYVVATYVVHVLFGCTMKNKIKVWRLFVKCMKKTRTPKDKTSRDKNKKTKKQKNKINRQKKKKKNNTSNTTNKNKIKSFKIIIYIYYTRIYLLFNIIM